MRSARTAVKAILLAAGVGSRLRPYTRSRPKCLVELGGRPLLDWQLATLDACGITDVVVVTGHRADRIARSGIRRLHNPLYRETNMVRSLWCARDELEGDVIVAYADIVYEPRVLRALLDAPDDLAIVVDRAWEPYWRFRFGDPLRDAETLRLAADGGVLEIGRRPASLTEIEGQYIGLLRFRDPGLAALRDFYEQARARAEAGERPWPIDRPFPQAYLTDLLDAWIRAGGRVSAVPVEAGWLEIDSREDLEKTAALFESGAISRFFDPWALEREARA